MASSIYDPASVLARLRKQRDETESKEARKPGVPYGQNPEYNPGQGVRVAPNGPPSREISYKQNQNNPGPGRLGRPKISPPALGQQRVYGKYTVTPQLKGFRGHDLAGKKLPPIRSKNNNAFF